MSSFAALVLRTAKITWAPEKAKALQDTTKDFLRYFLCASEGLHEGECVTGKQKIPVLEFRLHQQFERFERFSIFPRVLTDDEQSPKMKI